jgi:hypothetical protein
MLTFFKQDMTGDVETRDWVEGSSQDATLGSCSPRGSPIGDTMMDQTDNALSALDMISSGGDIMHLDCVDPLFLEADSAGAFNLPPISRQSRTSPKPPSKVEKPPVFLLKPPNKTTLGVRGRSFSDSEDSTSFSPNIR